MNNPINERVPITGQYMRTADGQLYFTHGRTRIKVTEHFPKQGKPISDLLTDVILFSAKQKGNQELPKAA